MGFDWGTLLAVLVGSFVTVLGGGLTTWYSVRRQDRLEHRRDLQARRSDVEDALAETEQVRSAVGSACNTALIRDEEQPYLKRVKAIGDLVPLADAAEGKLTKARIRHPGVEVREALQGLAQEMSRLSTWADFVAWAEEHKPDDFRLDGTSAGLNARVEQLRSLLDEADRLLRDYHADKDA